MALTVLKSFSPISDSFIVVKTKLSKVIFFYKIVFVVMKNIFPPIGSTDTVNVLSVNQL